MASATKRPNAPGLKQRKRGDGFAYYWIPPSRAIAAGFPMRCVSLTEATEPERATRCRALWADLEAWRRGEKSKGPAEHSLEWVINRYKSDKISSYHGLRGRTKRSYDYLCKKLAFELGHWIIAGITGEDVLEWYGDWVEKNGPSAARHAITMLRGLAKYAIIIRVPGAKDLVLLLCDILRFPSTPPRAIAPTWDEVKRIVDQAESDGYLSIAITTQAQRDLIERRTHIIGYWESGDWRPGWEWANVTDWKIKYFQTKNELVLREVDLRDTPRLFELMQRIPEAERFGPIIKCERKRKGYVKRPWNERHYADVFREICRRAGVHDGIKSMDLRASGATEADLTPGVTDRMLQDAMGHSDPRTKDRYRRQKQRNHQNVIKLVQAQNKATSETDVPRSSGTE